MSTNTLVYKKVGFKCCNTTKKLSALSIVCLDTFGFFDEGLQIATAISLRSDLRIHFARDNNGLKFKIRWRHTRQSVAPDVYLEHSNIYTYIILVCNFVALSRCSYIAHVGSGLNIRELTFLVNQSIFSVCEVASVSRVN